ncbi:DUF1801 domain-containing protein [Ferruginibacter paludis]|uniref:iron chaperone n=1 Tax=Ferruginibacter TaxID=1004303 RepID=UPI0025B3A300|nr:MULTISPECIES: DUF1801 domain-containing protein [Ferruginibacter]MDB5278184.1 hypothetical protein [Ferruginibacter sp.]MDN3657004.1 DUF1801 domain-containing protein [Ferruginibacter paludis]
MKTVTAKQHGIDDYITGFPERIQRLLKLFRSAIISAAPEAEEVISYQMPAFKYHGMLVYFSAHRSHIGLYPSGSCIAHFKEELSMYATSKGAILFPMDQPPPLELIKKIVSFCVQENAQRAAEKVKVTKYKLQ